MNILFYTVANKRSRDIESQAIEFAAAGHSIFLLTQSPRSELHDFFESHGFYSAFTPSFKSIFPVYVCRQVILLVKFCFRHKITVLHSHLDPCNLIAVLSQPVLHAKVLVSRHHADALLYEASAKTQWLSRWIYRMARHIVVVSENTKKYMVAAEGISKNKITVIPLSYRFELYDQPTEQEVSQQKKMYDAQVLLCTVGRFTALKRIDQIIRLVYELNNAGVRTRLLVVGNGHEEAALKTLTKKLALTDQVIFVGFSTHVLPYVAAADYYIHFSVTEASCTTVKEAALVGTPVIVCNGVGDFNEYISSANGFIVDKDNAVAEARDLILKTYTNKPLLAKLGAALSRTVYSRFDIKNVMPLYQQLHTNILK